MDVVDDDGIGLWMNMMKVMMAEQVDRCCWWK